MRTLTKISAVIACAAAATMANAQPQYQIFDIGVIQMTDNSSQGFNASPGGVAVGRSIQGTSTSQAFTWTQGGGLVGLPSLAGRNHSVSNSANDNGIVVGTAATTLFGSSRLPVIWNNGAVSQLPLPAGETLGDANSVNASGVAVGSVDGGSLQQAVIYNGSTATVITQTTSTGCFFVTAFGINNSGRIVGTGIDPGNAARNVGMVYDMGAGSAFEVGAVPGANGALAFAVSNGGHVVGSSMMNQGSGTPFIWSSADGMVAIPLASGTSQGSARGVNSAGSVVGIDSSAFSIPFLWDGTTTYRIADLLPPGSGWDLDMNTSSSALGISDDGVIVGTGMHNGNLRAYAMVPVQATPTPTPTPPVTTPTPTPAATPTPTPQATATPTATPEVTATPSATPEGTATPEPSPTSTPPTQALNVSTRLRVQTGDNVGIGGFIITGTDSKHVLLRGIGPSLASSGITDVLADPTLDLRNSAGVSIRANDNWRDAQEAEIKATGIPPTDDLEAAIVETLDPGTYTVILRGLGMTSGVGLVEIYDLDQGSDSKLANLSTRAFVSTGDNVVIAGFILGGSGDDRVIMRGIGPSLTAQGVANALPDPTLELRNSNGALLASNNDWQDNAAPPGGPPPGLPPGLEPGNPLESVIVATLPPGLYTALLAGRNNGTGVGLVEVYDLGP